MPCTYASCNNCCIAHSTSAAADPELVSGGGGWSCMLLLHPIQTCTDAVLTYAPCTLTFAPCACGGCHWQQLTVVVFLPQPLAQRLHLHPRWFQTLQLAPVVFTFHPLAQTLDLHLGNLHCVVVVFGGSGGSCMYM